MRRSDRPSSADDLKNDCPPPPSKEAHEAEIVQTHKSTTAKQNPEASNVRFCVRWVNFVELYVRMEAEKLGAVRWRKERRERRGWSSDREGDR